jgi:hypothetical protein
MAFAARAAGQGASLLSSRPCAPIAEIVLRHGPVERHALARPSSSDRLESGRRLLQPRRPALALAEYPKRIAKTRPESWAGDLPPKRRRPEPAGQTMGGCYRCKFAAWTAAVR